MFIIKVRWLWESSEPKIDAYPNNFKFMQEKKHTKCLKLGISRKYRKSMTGGTCEYYIKATLVKNSCLSGLDPESFKGNEESKVNLE